MTPWQAEVEVTKLGKVIVKGVMVELPVTVGDFLLKRVGNSIIMVNGLVSSLLLVI